MKMKKYLKTFAAVMIVFGGAMSKAHFFIKPVSYSSMLIGVAGLLMLYPAISAYVKWFDNLFGK